MLQNLGVSPGGAGAILMGHQWKALVDIHARSYLWLESPFLPRMTILWVGFVLGLLLWFHVASHDLKEM